MTSNVIEWQDSPESRSTNQERVDTLLGACSHNWEYMNPLVRLLTGRIDPHIKSDDLRIPIRPQSLLALTQTARFALQIEWLSGIDKSRLSLVL